MILIQILKKSKMTFVAREKDSTRYKMYVYCHPYAPATKTTAQTTFILSLECHL